MSDLLAIAQRNGIALVFRDGRSTFCGFSKVGRENRAFPDEACRTGTGVEEVGARDVRSDPHLREIVWEALTLEPDEGDGEATGFVEFAMMFGRLDNLTDRPSVMAKLARAAMRQAFRNHVSYLELKVNPIGRTEATLTGEGWADTPVAIEEVASLLRQAVEEENRRLVEVWEASPGGAGGWPEGWPAPVEVRFIVGGNRTRPLREGGLSRMDPIRCEDPAAEVCPSRLRQAFYLTGISPHAKLFVGIDFVGLPEVDSPTDEPLGQILTGLTRESGPVNITLHAGETANPSWRDHVAQALAAGARRIGHGLNMRASETSLELFCRAPGTGYLPVSLNTDDAGVFETDLSAEFLKAVEAFDLTWEEVKRLARNSLLFSFADAGTRIALLERWEEEVAALEDGWSW